jgi:hypothetical protein
MIDYARRHAVGLMGVVLVAMGVFMVVDDRAKDREQDREQDREFRSCISVQFAKLDTALTPRGVLNEREAQITKDIILTVTTPGVKDAAVIAAVAKYRTDTAKLQAERKATPLPKFPDGTCE